MTSTGYRSALVVGEFRALAGSSLISILGDSAAYLAVTVLVYQRTGSSFLSSLTFAVAFVPYVFGGTVLSSLVDRLPPRRLLVTCDLVSAVLVASIALPAVPIGYVFVVLFLIGTLAPIRGGTSSALVAEVLPGEEFVAGRSVLRIIAQTAQIAGAAAGGAVIAPLGPHGALLADAGSFLLSAAVITIGVRSRQQLHADGTTRGVVGESLQGLAEIWRHVRVRRLLLLGWLVPFVSVAPEGLSAPAVTAQGLPIGLVGVWLVAIPVGTVIGDLLFVWFVPVAWRVRSTMPLALALTVSLVLFAARPPFAVQLALLVAGGMCSAYGLGLDQSLRGDTPPRLLARVYAINGTGLMVSQGLGFAVAGAVAGVMSPDATIAVAGALGLVGLFVLTPRPAR